MWILQGESNLILTNQLQTAIDFLNTEADLTEDSNFKQFINKESRRNAAAPGGRDTRTVAQIWRNARDGLIFEYFLLKYSRQTGAKRSTNKFVDYIFMGKTFDNKVMTTKNLYFSDTSLFGSYKPTDTIDSSTGQILSGTHTHNTTAVAKGNGYGLIGRVAKSVVEYISIVSPYVITIPGGRKTQFKNHGVYLASEIINSTYIRPSLYPRKRVLLVSGISHLKR